MNGKTTAKLFACGELCSHQQCNDLFMQAWFKSKK